MKNQVSELIDSSLTKQIFGDMLSKYKLNAVFYDEDCKLLVKEMNLNILAKHSPLVIFILEFSTQSYLYVSENIKNEIAITAQELMEGGLSRGIECLKENHRNVFLEKILPNLFEQYHCYAATGEAKDIHAAYDTIMYNSAGELQWFLHQVRVLSCDENGFPRHALKIISNINDYKTDDRIAFNAWKNNGKMEKQTLLSTYFLPHDVDQLLSSREKEIFDMTELGHSAKDIAEKLFISINTVNTHRRNITKKLKELQESTS